MPREVEIETLCSAMVRERWKVTLPDEHEFDSDGEAAMEVLGEGRAEFISERAEDEQDRELVRIIEEDA